MAKTALATTTKRSLLGLFSASSRPANSPVSVKSEDSFMNQHVDRRKLVTTSAAAIAVAGTATCGATQALAKPDYELEVPTLENPELLAAAEALAAAQAEHAAATDALNWLADEWRHRWPLAPEEILSGANAHHTYLRTRDDAERDIAGRFIMREKAELTKRLSRRFRREGGKTCFAVERADEIARRLASYRKDRPRSKTADALARRVIAELEIALPLARQYEAETARLRKAAGAKKAIRRERDADARVKAQMAEIGKLPAFTVTGVIIKATAIKSIFDAHKLAGIEGVFGDCYNLAADAVKLPHGPQIAHRRHAA